MHSSTPLTLSLFTLLSLLFTAAAAPTSNLRLRQDGSDTAIVPPEVESSDTISWIPTEEEEGSDGDNPFSSSPSYKGSSPDVFEDFYLVTTTSEACVANSSELANVSALSLFAPLHTNTPLLRQIGPGYLSLPKFNLTSGGTLTTWSADGFGKGMYLYGNQAVMSEEGLTFAQGANTNGGGGVSMKSSAGGNACLVEIGGASDGWSICPGPLGEKVITYRGSGEGCSSVFLQAVKSAPY